MKGKGDSADSHSLLYQLFANMILTGITSFVEKCGKVNDAFIRDVKVLSAYGIAYMGIGQVGFYKLQMKFGYPAKFVVKFPLEERTKPASAACVDYTLDYFFENLNKSKNKDKNEY